MCGVRVTGHMAHTVRFESTCLNRLQTFLRPVTSREWRVRVCILELPFA